MVKEKTPIRGKKIYSTGDLWLRRSREMDGARRYRLLIWKDGAVRTLRFARERN